MDRSAALLLILGGIALLAAAGSAGAASTWASGPDPSPPLEPPPDQAAVDQAVSDIAQSGDPVAAFLAVIRQFESHNDYSILYGGGHFSDFSHHPNIAVPINLPGYAGKKSTAAGAYQINFPTYTEFAPALGITDFSPASQDRLAMAILQKSGAYDAILQNDIPGAFNLAAKRWASLPGSTAAQNPQSMTVAMNVFDQWLTTGV